MPANLSAQSSQSSLPTSNASLASLQSKGPAVYLGGKFAATVRMFGLVQILDWYLGKVGGGFRRSVSRYKVLGSH